jgi:hypothetical protein
MLSYFVGREKNKKTASRRFFFIWVGKYAIIFPKFPLPFLKYAPNRHEQTKAKRNATNSIVQTVSGQLDT